MSKYKVDIEEYNHLLNRLTSEEVRKSITYTVRSGANRLRKKTIENFGTGTKFKSYNVYRDRNGSTKRLSLVTVNLGRNKQSATVHIMGDFRAKFFELGTRRRTAKGRKVTGEYRKGNRTYLSRTGKPANRGIITKRRYFAKAQDSEETKVLGEMQNRVEKKIVQIGRKK